MKYKGLQTFSKVTDRISYLFCYLAMFTIVVMMVLVCADVIMGNFLHKPVAGIYEICSLLLTTTIFSSWAYTQTVHGHIHVTMFIRKMPQKLRFICYGITSAISTVTMCIATYGATLATIKKVETNEFSGTLQIPFWPFYTFMVIAFALLAILLGRDTVKAFIAMFDKDMAEEIMKDWT